MSNRKQKAKSSNTLKAACDNWQNLDKENKRKFRKQNEFELFTGNFNVV